MDLVSSQCKALNNHQHQTQPTKASLRASLDGIVTKYYKMGWKGTLFTSWSIRSIIMLQWKRMKINQINHHVPICSYDFHSHSGGIIHPFFDHILGTEMEGGNPGWDHWGSCSSESAGLAPATKQKLNQPLAGGPDRGHECVVKML